MENDIQKYASQDGKDLILQILQINGRNLISRWIQVRMCRIILQEWEKTQKDKIALSNDT